MLNGSSRPLGMDSQLLGHLDRAHGMAPKGDRGPPRLKGQHARQDAGLAVLGLLCCATLSCVMRTGPCSLPQGTIHSTGNALQYVSAMRGTAAIGAGIHPRHQGPAPNWALPEAPKSWGPHGRGQHLGEGKWGEVRGMRQGRVLSTPGRFFVTALVPALGRAGAPL